MTEDYVRLVPSENQSKPKFLAAVRALVQPSSDTQSFLDDFLAKHFYVQTATGAQLDTLGLWVGISRRITGVIADNIYFSLDDAALGFDLGIWTNDAALPSGTSVLDDDTYRVLILAKIAANSWNGTVEDYRRVLGIVFASIGTQIAVIDNFDMSMQVLTTGPQLSAVLRAVLTGGFVPIKPQGVSLAFTTASAPGTPAFGFDSSSLSVSGFDVGSWAVPL